MQTCEASIIAPLSYRCTYWTRTAISPAGCVGRPERGNECAPCDQTSQRFNSRIWKISRHGVVAGKRLGICRAKSGNADNDAFNNEVPEQPDNSTRMRGRSGNKDTGKQNNSDEGAAETKYSDRGWTGYNIQDFLEEGIPIGAEHGEGFTSYRPSGGPLHLDVELLNDRMRQTGKRRARFALKPDEAFGAIFALDGVLCDTRPLQKKSWELLAAEEGFKMPSVPRPIYGVGVERVISEVFRWTQDPRDVRRLAARLSEIYRDEFIQRPVLLPGVMDWLMAMAKVGLPCAVTSHMERARVVGALTSMGVSEFFQAIVSAEDDMESKAQRYLSAAVKIDRPPLKCVVFEDDPRGVTAAHNCSMKSIAVLGSYKAYELQQADLTVSSMDELSIVNIRRLFANQGDELMDLKTEKIGKETRKPRRLRHGTLW
eukprot:jgi/Mesvir1/28018/Mv04627-RA.1